MKNRRKHYYHKTIVLKGTASHLVLHSALLLFSLGLLVSVISRVPIHPSRQFVLSSFSEVFFVDTKPLFVKRTVYDHVASVIPAVRSGETMMKKYAAKYGGVKKELPQTMKRNNKQEEVHEQPHVKEIDMSKNGITFRNETAYTPKVSSLLEEKLQFSDVASPTVLILHTHTSEAYAESEGARTTDDTKNVVRVGTVLKETLEKEGIGVVHDTVRNDYPTYNGSYNKALSTITKNKEAYPSIQVVLDVHRDYAEQTNNGEKVQLKPVAEVNGEKVAQVMFVVGTDGNGLTHPNWTKNLAFAAQIQQRLNTVSPKLSRPINLRRERFNQHITQGSLIVEVGTAGNTLAECERAAVYIGKAVAKVLKGNE